MSTLQVDRIIPYQSSSVVIEGLSVANLATTGSNTFVGDQNIQGTITASIQEGFALVGGVGNVSTLVATSSFGGAVDTSSLATTGSNSFVGNQVITGSVFISGSDTFDLNVVGSMIANGPTAGVSSRATDSSMSVVSGSTNLLLTPLAMNLGSGGGVANRIGIYSNPTLANIGINSTHPSIIVNRSFPPFQVHAVEFTDGTTLGIRLPTQITGSLNITDVLQLAGQDPLPAGGVGQLAVSASGDLYYHNGVGWQLK